MAKWAFNNQPRCQQCKRFISRKTTDAEIKLEQVALTIIAPFLEMALDEDYIAEPLFDATEDETEYNAVYAKMKAIINEIRERIQP